MDCVLTSNKEIRNIGIITSPISKSGCIPTSNLLDILYSVSNNVFLITGNHGYEYFKDDSRLQAYGVVHKNETNPILRIYNYVCMQFKLSMILFNVSRNVDIWVFFIGGDSLVLPMITAKLMRKKVILAFASSSVKTHKAAGDKLSYPLNFILHVNCWLANQIVLYSKNLAYEWNLEKYQSKITIAPRHFLDFSKYPVKNNSHANGHLVGYVGRLSQEKGVMNFVESIPMLLKEKPDLKFLIVGDGSLRHYIEKYLRDNDLVKNVKIYGWIPHDRIPDLLSKLTIVVLPSYTEGLPNIILECMACNTLVLSTPVGSIPDIVKDAETGFIMESNSPECIADNLIRVLEYPNLTNIVNNARAFVEKNFTYEAAIGRYSSILEKI